MYLLEFFLYDMESHKSQLINWYSKRHGKNENQARLHTDTIKAEEK